MHARQFRASQTLKLTVLAIADKGSSIDGSLQLLDQTCQDSSLNMPRSDEAAMWYAAVYSAVQEIPYGKVTSYGHIASMLGYRECIVTSTWTND